MVGNVVRAVQHLAEEIERVTSRHLSSTRVEDRLREAMTNAGMAQVETTARIRGSLRSIASETP
jgi:ribosomal 50S subunit-associated protein YjgA (DUF615 family)